MNWLLLLAVFGASAVGSAIGLTVLLLLAWRFGRKAVVTQAAATTVPAASLRLVTDDDEKGSAS